MQYLLIKDSDTLLSVSNIVGSQNMDTLLSENGLTRSPHIGRQWRKKCNDLLANNPPEISGSRKASLLNTLTGSQELFEKACLMDENEWKIFDAFLSFPDMLRIPETVIVPFSERVLGDLVGRSIASSAVSGASSGRSLTNRYGNRNESGAVTSSVSSTTQTRVAEPTSSGTYSGSNNQSSVTGIAGSTRSQSSPVDSVVYRAVMQNLKESDFIDPVIFNGVNTSSAVTSGVAADLASSDTNFNFSAWKLPWGKIIVSSSLLHKSIQIPVYPEELDETRTATYTAMPDIIYQYEPWIVYQSSGPREQSVTFHLHRDMWTGDHRDGKAAELINFCKASTFPRYSGSMVLSTTFTIYINGVNYVSGALTNVQVHWKGPLGLDNWYLEFELVLTIQEVSDVPLNIDDVNKFGLIGSGG